MLLAAALLAVSALRAAPTCAAADDLARLLAAAVDLPTPEARRDAAVKLAGREDVTLEAAGARDARLVEFSDRGHDFDPHAVDWKEFLARAVREPMRPRVVRACARLDEARSAWAEVTRFAAGIDETFRPDISAAELKKLDESGKRAWVQGEADRRTARLEVKMDDVGRFTATTSGVQRFRLLLPAEMFVARAPVEVTTNGRLARYEAKASKLVLLREFVERFDRTFLPVAEISCP